MDITDEASQIVADMEARGFPLPTPPTHAQREAQLTNNGRLIITGKVKDDCEQCDGVGTIATPEGPRYCSATGCAATARVHQKQGA